MYIARQVLWTNVCIALSAVFFVVPSPVHAADTVIYVNTQIDAEDSTPDDAICDIQLTDVGNHCSLRAAVQTAHNIAGPVTIVINGSQNYIALNNQLPAITTHITLVGKYTQPVVIDAVNHSRIFFVEKGGMLEVENIEFRNGVADRGGAIYSRGTVSIKKSVFTANRSFEGGGAIHTEYGNLNVESSKFWENKTDGFGGAISAIASTITLGPGTDLTSNSSMGPAGAIFFADSAVKMSTVVVSNNESRKLGGALYVQNSIVDIEDSSLYRNHAFFEGGALYSFDASQINILNSSLSENTAIHGSVLYSKNSKFTINGSVIEKNTASINLYEKFSLKYWEDPSFVEEDPTFLIEDRDIHGSAIFVEDTLQRAERGIPRTVDLINDSTIRENEFVSGAPIIIDIKNENHTLHIDGSIIEKNEAFIAALDVRDGYVRIAAGTEIRNNNGIYTSAIRNKDTVLIDSTIIQNNISTCVLPILCTGPALNFGTMTIKGSKFSHNTLSFKGIQGKKLSDAAVRQGGAVYNAAGAKLNLITTDIRYHGTDVGGAIYNAGTLALENTTVWHNHANAMGGGVYSSGPLSLKSSNIFYNTAEVYGAGMYVTGNGFGSDTAVQTTIEGSTIMHNSLESYPIVENRAGAGMYIADGAGVYIENTRIEQNKADIFYGISTGGMYPGDGVYNAGELELHDVELNENQGDGLYNIGTAYIEQSRITAQRKEGIYNEGTLEVASSTIKSNNDTGVQNHGLLHIHDSKIVGNINKGIVSTNTLLIEETEITSNDQYGISVQKNSVSEIKHSNISAHNRQGVLVEGGLPGESKPYVSIDGSSISKNKWGAVRVLGDFDIDINDTDILYNGTTPQEYTLVGGIFIENGWGVLKVTKSAIHHNVGRWAAAIYASIDEETMNTYNTFPRVYISNTTISDNTAKTLWVTGPSSWAGDGSIPFSGGIYGNSALIEIYASTIKDNYAEGEYHFGEWDDDLREKGGNITYHTSSTDAGITIKNTIIDGIPTWNDQVLYSCDIDPADVNSLGYNMSTDDSCGLSHETDQIVDDIKFLPSAKYNEQNTPVYMLQPDSPAVDGGSCITYSWVNTLPIPLLFDQHGTLRDQDACDIGAYELPQYN